MYNSPPTITSLPESHYSEFSTQTIIPFTQNSSTQYGLSEHPDIFNVFSLFVNNLDENLRIAKCDYVADLLCDHMSTTFKYIKFEAKVGAFVICNNEIRNAIKQRQINDFDRGLESSLVFNDTSEKNKIDIPDKKCSGSIFQYSAYFPIGILDLSIM